MKSQREGENEETNKEIQRWALTQFVNLSKEYDLPLNVHSRSAGRPTIQLLQENGATKVNLHSFDGSYKVAKQAISLGYNFSVPPSIIRNRLLQNVIEKIPLHLLLLESDAPGLGPVKGVPNCPANVYISCSEIATLHHLSYAEVAKTTTENAKKLFPKAFL